MAGGRVLCSLAGPEASIATVIARSILPETVPAELEFRRSTTFRSSHADPTLCGRKRSSQGTPDVRSSLVAPHPVAINLVWTVGSLLSGRRSTYGEQWTRVLAGPVRGSVLAVPMRERPSYVLGRYEPHVMDQFKRHLRSGSVAYDVGAHVGYCTLAMAKWVGASGSVVAIEAEPRNVALLRKNVENNGIRTVTVLESAIGDACGTVDFAAFDGCSTVGHIHTDNSPDDARVVTVPITTIDKMVLDHAFPAPDLIKLDVEGAETAVILGALSTLAQHTPVIIAELRLGSTYEEIQDLLAPIGYQALTLESRGDNARDGVIDVLLSVAGAG
jgi:FkbM family methyltransferase